MRDFVHQNLTVSGASASAVVPDTWYPELTKQQKIRAYKQCHQLFKNTNTATATAAVPNETDFSLIDNNLEIQSLSHAYLLIGALRATLLDVCSAQKIDAQQAVADSILSRSSGYSDKLLELFSSNKQQSSDSLNSIGIITDDSMAPGTDFAHSDVNNSPNKTPTGRNTTHNNNNSAKKTPTNGSNTSGKKRAPSLSHPSNSLSNIPEDGSAHFPDHNFNLLNNNNHSNGTENGYDDEYNEDKPARSAEETAIAFEAYKLDQGAKQNRSYEDAKEALKLTKSRQADIILLLNSQKALIDSLNTQVSDISVSQEDIIDEAREEQKIALQAQLEGAKKAYRSAHNELKLCKDQIAETQSLKKRAMTTLLNTFHDYYDNL